MLRPGWKDVQAERGYRSPLLPDTALRLWEAAQLSGRSRLGRKELGTAGLESEPRHTASPFKGSSEVQEVSKSSEPNLSPQMHGLSCEGAGGISGHQFRVRTEEKRQPLAPAI